MNPARQGWYCEHFANIFLRAQSRLPRKVGLHGHLCQPHTVMCRGPFSVEFLNAPDSGATEIGHVCGDTCASISGSPVARTMGDGLAAVVRRRSRWT